MKIGRYDADGNLVESREVAEPRDATRPATVPLDPPLHVEPGDVVVVADSGDTKVTRHARHGVICHATFQL